MHMQVILTDRRSSFQKCLSRISVAMSFDPSDIAYSRYIPPVARRVRLSSAGSSVSSGEFGLAIEPELWFYWERCLRSLVKR